MINLINIPEAARLLKRDRTTIWRWVDDGKLKPALVVSSHAGKRQQVFFERAQIEALVPQREEVAA